MRGFTLLAVGFGVVACGPSGEGCTIAHHDDGTSALICPDGTSATILDGADGPDSSGGTAVSGAFYGDIVLMEAADVVQFANVTELWGDLTINTHTLTSVALPYLRMVVGDVAVGRPTEDQLTAIDFPALETVKGSVSVDGTGLRDLSGFDALTFVGEGLVLQGNKALRTLSGLEQLDTLWGPFIISANPVLANVDGLVSLSHTVLTVQLFISGNDSLESLVGLRGVEGVKGQLYISGNPRLGSLSGLEVLQKIEGSAVIYGNKALSSLSGLHALTTVENGLLIYDNTSLTSLSGLDSLITAGDTLTISSNPALCQDKVDAFVAALRAKGWDGSASSSGNTGACFP